jgi:valyl-tRNA synthetase
MNLTIDEIKLPAVDELAKEDKWILDEFNKLVSNVTTALDKFEVGVALAAIYDFTWDIFCDWYIELSKTRLNAKDTAENLVAQNVIAYVLTGTLKLLHPFMPFITEEIYQALPHTDESIMISKYPEYSADLVFTADSESMAKIISAIKAIRARRNEMNVVPSRKAKVYIATKHTDSFNALTSVFFERLASASEVEVADSFDGVIDADSAVQIITDSATIFLPLSDLVDTEKERARLEAEQKKLLGEIERLEKKLSNEGFVAKAPAAVVDAEKAKLAKYRENLDGVVSALDKLNK